MTLPLGGPMPANSASVPGVSRCLWSSVLAACTTGERGVPLAVACVAPASRLGVERTARGLQFGGTKARATLLRLRCTCAGVVVPDRLHFPLLEQVQHHVPVSRAPTECHQLSLSGGATVVPLVWWLRRCERQGLPLALELSDVANHVALSAYTAPFTLISLALFLDGGGTFNAGELQPPALDHVRSVFLTSLDAGAEGVVEKAEALAALPSLEFACFERIGISLERVVRHDDWRHLSTLVLRKCASLQTLSAVASMPALRSLTVDECNNVSGLVAEPVRVRHLEFVKFARCAAVTEMDMVSYRYLRFLAVEQCASLRLLSVLDSDQLRYLRVSRCRSLRELCGTRGKEYLGAIDLLHCDSLPSLDLRECICLSQLDVSSCALLSVVRGVASLESLECIRLSGDLAICSVLGSALVNGADDDVLHLSFGNVAFRHHLRRLQIKDADALVALDVGALTALSELGVYTCRRLRDITGVSCNPALQTLALGWCESLSHLSLAEAIQLSVLSVHACPALRSLDGLAALECVERMDLSDDTVLAALAPVPTLGPSSWGFPDMAWGCALVSLTLTACGQQLEVLSVAGLESLHDLTIGSCDALRDLVGLEGKHALQQLFIQGCGSLMHLNLSPLAGLHELRLAYCPQLKVVDGVKEKPRLGEVGVYHCGVAELDFTGSVNLRECVLRKCESLVAVRGLLTAHHLSKVELDRCARVQSLELSESGKGVAQIIT